MRGWGWSGLVFGFWAQPLLFVGLSLGGGACVGLSWASCASVLPGPLGLACASLPRARFRVLGSGALVCGVVFGGWGLRGASLGSACGLSPQGSLSCSGLGRSCLWGCLWGGGGSCLWGSWGGDLESRGSDRLIFVRSALIFSGGSRALVFLFSGALTTHGGL